ncbi:MAG: glycosyltransferase [Clostridia bacterium]|nr:glycosyltransferase [Clostridia bacterium]
MEKETFTPLVSVIIPVYNGADYMREAIDSALAQTYKNKEIIVVNDGSSDNGETERIAKQYGDKIRYIYKENGGVSSALNTGIRNMRGEYFSWLSHDDVYTPDKIEKQIKALSDIENKTTLVCCDYVHIDKNSKVIGNISRASDGVKLLSWEEMLVSLFKNGPMHGCALLINKSIFEEVGMFDESLRYFQDVFMWYKIFVAKHAMLSTSDICVKGRIHDKQLTQKGHLLFRKDSETVSAVIIPQLLQISTKKNNFLFEYVKYNAKYGNRRIVKNVRTQAKGTKLIGTKETLTISLMSIYSVIRPIIRKIFYRVFRRINIA